MDLIELSHPARQRILDVLAKRLGQFKESWTWLHVAGLVDNNSRQHASPCPIFFAAYLTEKMK